MTGKPTQVPFTQPSFEVQTLPSLHGLPFAFGTESQMPPMHAACRHGFAGFGHGVVSLPVQRTQPGTGVLAHAPVSGLHVSDVHGSPSLQFFSGPGWHTPF